MLALGVAAGKGLVATAQSRCRGLVNDGTVQETTASRACRSLTARASSIAYFTRTDACQLFLKAVVRKFCVRHIADTLRWHFYSLSEMYRYYAPEITKSSQSTQE